jgi:MFS family permease
VTTSPESAPKRPWIDMNTFLSMHLPSISIGFGLGATITVLPELSKDFGAGFWAAIWVFILQQAGTVVAPIPTGYLIDRFGRRGMLLAGPFVIALSSLLIVRVVVMDGSFNEILFYRFIGGIGEQMWMLSRITVIADTAGSQQRGKQITSMFGVQQIGNLTGPIVGGATSVAFGIWVPFALHAVIVVLAVIPSFYLVKETLVRAPIRPGDVGKADAARAKLTMADLRTPPIPQVFAAQFLANITRGGIFGGGVIVVYASYGFGLSELEIGGLRSAMAFIGIPIMFGAGYVMDRYGRKYTIVPGLIFSGLSMVALALVDWYTMPLEAFIVAFVMVHLAVSVISGNMQTLNTDVAPAHARGSFLGVSRLVAQVGSLASPAGFGALKVVSFAAGFSLLGGTAFLAALVVFFGIPETLRKQERPANEDETKPTKPQAG